MFNNSGMLVAPFVQGCRSIMEAGTNSRSRPEGIPVIALIGTTNLPSISQATGIGVGQYEEAARSAAPLVARLGFALAVVPDRGVARLGLESYRSAEGPWLIGLTPTQGPADPEASANCIANARSCDEVIDDLSWHHQHAALCELADAMICVGLSCGTITEIAWTKWMGRKPVFVLRSTVTRIPVEITAETSIEFVADVAALERALPGSVRRVQG